MYDLILLHVVDFGHIVTFYNINITLVLTFLVCPSIFLFLEKVSLYCHREFESKVTTFKVIKEISK